MTENQDDVLSFMGSDHENYSDIDELFGDKPRTRSVTEDTITNATNKRTRGMFKAQSVDLMFSECKCTATTGDKTI